MTTWQWIITLMYSGYPSAALIWAKNAVTTYRKNIPENQDRASSDHVREILENEGSSTYRKDYFEGIQPAYTFGVGPKGGALILFFKQRTKGASRDAYLQDRLYYNKQGQHLCEQMNIKYRGSDSGLWQNSTTYLKILDVFSDRVKKKIRKFVNFTTAFHLTGEPEIEARGKRKIVIREAYDLGNGQGLQYTNPDRSPNKKLPFPLHNIPPSFRMDQKNKILPDDVIWIPAQPNERPDPLPAQKVIQNETHPQPQDQKALSESEAAYNRAKNGYHRELRSLNP